MKAGYRMIIVLAMALVVVAAALPGLAEKGGEGENIWSEGGPRRQRRGPGPGPGPGPGRGPRFELSDEEIDRIMKDLKERDPAKAEELAKLRETEPQKFKEELIKHGRQEFGRIIRERINKWRQQRREEFLKWLEKNFQEEAKELSKLKDTVPDLYNKKFDLIWDKYRPIYEAWRRNPELGEVKKESFKLRNKRDELLRRIKATRSEQEKKELIIQVEEVVASRFDLILREKEIEYERLLKRLEELQKHVRKRRDEIEDWKNAKNKEENVKKRVEALLGDGKFPWD